MSAENLAELIGEIRNAASAMVDADARTTERMNGFEKSLNSLTLQVRRPGAEWTGANDTDERKEARELCILKRELEMPKNDGLCEYVPSPDQIANAQNYRRGLRSLWRHGDPSKCDNDVRKSLSAFSFGTNQFIMPPEISTQILSCVVEPTDVSSLVNTVNISAPSIKFTIDNTRLNIAAWACESSCFANNPASDLAAGIATAEIKAESLRYIVCATRDLLEDAAVNVESWIIQKVSDGFRAAISNAILTGDGLGRPLGILTPQAGIPVLDTSDNTPPGQVTWQDLAMTKWDVPVEWHSNGTYLMNQRTWALISTMTDAIGRPLFTPSPIQGQAALLLNGSPVIIVSQMPDCLPGNTPVLFADLKRLYMLVRRSGVTMTPDPFTGGWCTIFKFDSRIGGAVVCPAAGRLLRVH